MTTVACDRCGKIMDHGHLNMVSIIRNSWKIDGSGAEIAEVCSVCYLAIVDFCTAWKKTYK